MASKVLVKLPPAPFSQSEKLTLGLMSLPNRNDGIVQSKNQRFDEDRAAQLEQNMKFLQEQHQITLAALHQEVESLRQRNRDLQFQLVFSRGNNESSEVCSSPRNGENASVESTRNSTSVKITPPHQVELLKKDLQDTKTALEEAIKQNVHLSGISKEENKISSAVTDVAVQVEENSDLERIDVINRLEDAETVVRRLRQINEEQRKEIDRMKVTSCKSNVRNRGSHNRDSQCEYDEHNPHKFPPLQTQSYWYRNSREKYRVNHNSDYYRNGRNRGERRERDSAGDDTVILPQLRNGTNKYDNSSSYSTFPQSKAHTNGGGNYQREGRNRRYRGQKFQRERRDAEVQDHQQEYNEHGYFESAGANGSRVFRNPRRQ